MTMTQEILKPPYLFRYSEKEYFADPCERPSFTQSTAKTLLSRSPFHAWTFHPRFGGYKRQATDEMNKGSLIHTMLLGVGKEIVAIEADNYRTKAAQEARDEALALGQIPMLAREVEEAEKMVEAIRSQLDDFGIELGREREVTAVWEEESAHGPVLCRAMFDALEPRVVLQDLKTCKQADLHSVQQAFTKWGYDLQYAAYTSAFRHLWPDMAGREDFVFLFVETEYPFCVTPVRPDGAMRALGESKWRRAVEKWSECLATGVWPKYTNGIVDLAPTSYALYQEEIAGGDVL